MNRKTQGTQPYQIRGVDALFGESAGIEAVAELLLISQICLPQKQPRCYFDSQAMEELVESIKHYGILQPLLVRPIGNDKYELVAGERRYRAAISVGLEKVPVIIRELADEEALQLAILENLQREDLNPIEETEGLLQLLALKVNETPESVIALLNQAAHPERHSVDNVIHSQKWQLVKEVFTTVGKFSPESFRTNRLPLLNLPSEVLDALRQGHIAYTKARAIAQVKNEAQRQALLKSAIEENLSLVQIKAFVTNINTVRAVDPSESTSLKSRVKAAYRIVEKSKVWEDPKKQKRLEKLLAEMEAIVASK
jgi:ParB family chromosome partitioning protein